MIVPFQAHNRPLWVRFLVLGRTRLYHSRRLHLAGGPSPVDDYLPQQQSSRFFRCLSSRRRVSSYERWWNLGLTSSVAQPVFWTTFQAQQRHILMISFLALWLTLSLVLLSKNWYFVCPDWLSLKPQLQSLVKVRGTLNMKWFHEFWSQFSLKSGQRSQCIQNRQPTSKLMIFKMPSNHERKKK